MNKDTIYIDIEDDITSIIGKVKAANNKIVALVPPKRIGVLQSAVNLKLLQKAALSVDKRVVLITSDNSLMTLAAGVRIPIAKNLQSRPEIPNVSAPQTAEEEVINGADLPVGEMAAALSPKTAAPERSAADEISEKVEIGTAAVEAAEGKTLKQAPGAAKSKFKPAGKSRIPNFEAFRKKFFIIGAAAVLLIGFIIWATVFAPHATVTISAKTTSVNIDRVLNLRPNLESSKPDDLELKPVTQQIKKSVAAEFDATGSKDIGNKATGTITVRNCDNSDGFTLPAGTRFTAGTGQVFASNQTATVPKFTGSANSCTLAGNNSGKVQIAVTAAELGPDYNIAAQSYSFSGAIPGAIDAIGTEMKGGTKEKVTIITQEDVDKAKATLTEQDKDEVKSELKKKFSAEQLIIEESFVVETGAPAVSPAVGEQAKRAKVTLETTYTLLGLDRDEIKTILTAAMNEATKDKLDQQAYSYGENAIHFQSFEKLENGTYSTRMNTTGYMGPKIDTQKLAEQISGKRFGEIEAIINEIPGVDKVDITFSPFWVTTAPGPDKTDIKFSVANEGQ